jgi:hypothetical protein
MGELIVSSLDDVDADGATAELVYRALAQTIE